MSNVIYLDNARAAEDRIRSGIQEGQCFEALLVSEGLELLHAYRSISDDGLRLIIKKLVEETAAHFANAKS